VLVFNWQLVGCCIIRLNNLSITSLINIIGPTGLIGPSASSACQLVSLIGFIPLVGLVSINLGGHNSIISLVDLSGFGLISPSGLSGLVGFFGHIGLVGCIGHIGLVGFMGLSLIGLMFFGHVSLIGGISLVGQISLVRLISHIIGLIGLNGISLIELVGLIGRIGLNGHNDVISLVSISGLINHNCLDGIIGLSLVGLLVSLSGINGLVGLNSLVTAIIAAAEFLVATAMQAVAAKTHGVAIKLARATKITNAAIWYYCAALLLVLLSLIWRESGLWCEWRVFSSLAGLNSVFKNTLQNAKQLFHISLPQMTKYCIMRECDNIRNGYLYVVTQHLLILKKIHGFKFLKRFLEISSRISLFCQSNHLKT
jgi:hypothetical protein